MAQPVARRRIAPIPIDNPARGDELLQPAYERTSDIPFEQDLKLQSKRAAELLGPGRKLYVNLAEGREVDWKRVGCKVVSKGLAFFVCLIRSELS